MSNKSDKKKRREIRKIAGEYRDVALIEFVAQLRYKVQEMSLVRRLKACAYILFKRSLKGLFDRD